MIRVGGRRIRRALRSKRASVPVVTAGCHHHGDPCAVETGELLLAAIVLASVPPVVRSARVDPRDVMKAE